MAFFRRKRLRLVSGSSAQTAYVLDAVSQRQTASSRGNLAGLLAAMVRMKRERIVAAIRR
jgi:hypothetical protein